MITHFTQLDAWKVNYEFLKEIYKATKGFPRDELYGLISQLRRAAASITANIAEGYGRFHFKDRLRFYYQARGSNCEVQNFLILSKDLGYLDEQSYNSLKLKVYRGYIVLNGLIRSTSELANNQ